jgi:hypothetical protein
MVVVWAELLQSRSQEPRAEAAGLVWKPALPAGDPRRKF